MKAGFLLPLTLFFILFTSGFTYAQLGMGNVKQIEEMKQRKLIVLLQPENQDVIKKLTKRGHADLIPVYKQKIEEFNDNFKEAVAVAWKYHKDAIYKTVDEVEALSKTKTTDYVVIMIYQKRTTFGTTISPYMDWNYKNVVKGEYDEDDKGYYDKTSAIRVVPIEHIYLGKMPIAMQGLTNIFPTKADIIAGIYGMTSYIDYRAGDKKASELKGEMKKLASELKEKTLLIRETDLAKKFTKENIQLIYPYKFNVVADSIFDQAVINRTSGDAFILTVPNEYSSSNIIVYSQVVYDCETGKTLDSVVPTREMASALAPNSIASKYGVGTGVGREMLDKKVFKELTDHVNGK